MQSGKGISHFHHIPSPKLNVNEEQHTRNTAVSQSRRMQRYNSKVSLRYLSCALVISCHFHSFGSPISQLQQCYCTASSFQHRDEMKGQFSLEGTLGDPSSNLLLKAESAMRQIHGRHVLSQNTVQPPHLPSPSTSDSWVPFILHPHIYITTYYLQHNTALLPSFSLPNR